MADSFLMQAVSDEDGKLYTWPASTKDWAAAGFLGPGSALYVAVAEGRVASAALASAPDQILLGNLSGSTAVPTPIDTAAVIARRGDVSGYIAPFESLAALVDATPVEGRRAETLYYTSVDDQAGVRVVGRSGDPGEFTGRPRFILPTGGDGSLAWEIIDETNGTIMPEKVTGAHPDKSASYNTGAFNDAFAAAGADNKNILMGFGEFEINDTVVIADSCGMKYMGGGASKALAKNAATVFRWVGADDRPAVRLQDCREMFLGNLRIDVYEDSPLLTGLQLYWSGLGVISTRNQIQHVTINGRGYCGTCVEITKAASAPDNNNSEHVFLDVAAKNFGDGDTGSGVRFADSAGFRNSVQGQSKVITFRDCTTNGDIERNGKYGYYGHSSFCWFRGSAGANDVDFYLTSPNDPALIEGVYSEKSKMFLDTVEAGSGSVMVNTCTVALTNIEAPYVGIRCLFSSGLRVNGGSYITGDAPMQIELGGVNYSAHEIRGATIESSSALHPIKYQNDDPTRTRVRFEGNSRRRGVGWGGVQYWHDIIPPVHFEEHWNPYLIFSADAPVTRNASTVLSVGEIARGGSFAAFGTSGPVLVKNDPDLAYTQDCFEFTNAGDTGLQLDTTSFPLAEQAIFHDGTSDFEIVFVIYVPSSAVASQAFFATADSWTSDSGLFALLASSNRLRVRITNAGTDVCDVTTAIDSVVPNTFQLGRIRFVQATSTLSLKIDLLNPTVSGAAVGAFDATPSTTSMTLGRRGDGAAHMDVKIASLFISKTLASTSLIDAQQVYYGGKYSIPGVAYPEVSTWEASTAYVLNDLVFLNQNIYVCRTAGTSASSGGPSGTGTGITDGTVVWDFLT